MEHKLLTQAFLNDIHSVSPSRSLLFQIDKEIRAALLANESHVVDKLFTELDVNRVNDFMVAQLRVSTDLYKHALRNREKFLRRADAAIKRKWLNVASEIIVMPKCPHCQIEMKTGDCLPGTTYGSKFIAPQPNLKGDDVKLIPVLKCHGCGHSETIDQFGESFGIELTRG